MNKKTIRDVDVKGKRVFCRVDFNVPMEDGNITDDTRIRAAIPTIQYLVEQGAKVILASHLGRPKDDNKDAFRLDPVAAHLSNLLGKKVMKCDEVIGAEATAAVHNLEDGDILLLENVRFHPGETKNDPELSKAFAAMADLFVNDAFGTAHRAHSSTAGIAQHVPAVAGFLMEKEIVFLGKALANPVRPFTAIIGGAKVKDKIGVIDSLLDKVDTLFVGGGLANTFIKAKGYEVGNSLVEDDKLDVAKSLMAKAEQKGVNFLIPEDVVIADAFANDAHTQVVDIANIPAGWQALDIGPKTVETYSQIVTEQSQLVLWNGPMGVFELSTFAAGTNAVARACADTSATTIIGGGDSVAAIEQAGLAAQITHISTGGGASLEFMEGKDLPGISVLQDKEE